MQDKMLQVVKQEIFNEVWAGASAQNFDRSFDDEKEICVYRDHESGRKCNVGLLIPDDRYDSTIEGSGVGFEGGSIFSKTTAYDRCKTAGFDQAGFDVIQAFLGEMQDAHDESSSAVEHKRRLESVANENHIEVPAEVAA